jgi:hypothetical protein
LVDGTSAAPAGNASVIANTRGQVLDFDGDGDRFAFAAATGLDALGSEPYAVVWRANQTSFTDNFATIATFDTGATNVWELFYTNSGSYKEVAWSQTGAGGFKAGFDLPGTATATLGEHLCIFAYNGQGVNALANYTLWVDGVGYSAGTTGTLSAATNRGIEVGGTQNFGTADFNGSIEFVGWLQGIEIDNGKAQSLTRDVYQLTKPANQQYYFPSVAAPGGLIISPPAVDSINAFDITQMLVPPVITFTEVDSANSIPSHDVKTGALITLTELDAVNDITGHDVKTGKLVTPATVDSVNDVPLHIIVQPQLVQLAEYDSQNLFNILSIQGGVIASRGSFRGTFVPGSLIRGNIFKNDGAQI